MNSDNNDPRLFQDQVVLITGAGRGIGLNLAQAFAAHGAHLILSDLGCERDGSSNDEGLIESVGAQLREQGTTLLTNSGDVGDPHAVELMFEQAQQHFGRVDVLINNAGIIADKNLFDLNIESWDAVIRTHLRGTFLCTQAFARLSRAKKTGGSVINMTSISGMLGNLGQINESSAKAGVYGLTRTASIELQKYRIRVNAIAPIAKTRLTYDLPMFEKVSGTLEAHHITPAALFLASQLSDDLSGVVLSVAGGRISCFELSESQGRVKEVDDGIWTPQEIAEHFDSIARR